MHGAFLFPRGQKSATNHPISGLKCPIVREPIPTPHTPMKSRNFIHNDEDYVATRIGSTVNVYRASGKPMTTVATHYFLSARLAKKFMADPFV